LPSFLSPVPAILRLCRSGSPGPGLPFLGSHFFSGQTSSHHARCSSKEERIFEPLFPLSVPWSSAARLPRRPFAGPLRVSPFFWGQRRSRVAPHHAWLLPCVQFQGPSSVVLDTTYHGGSPVARPAAPPKTRIFLISSLSPFPTTACLMEECLPPPLFLVPRPVPPCFPPLAFTSTSFVPIGLPRPI